MSEHEGSGSVDLDAFTPPELPNIGTPNPEGHLPIEKDPGYLKLSPEDRIRVQQNTRIAVAEGEDTRSGIDDLVKTGSLRKIDSEGDETRYRDVSGQREYVHNSQTGRLTLIKDEDGVDYRKEEQDSSREDEEE